MAKNRFINTRFWSDNFVVELNPLDRYLFLYLLTNEHTNICGIYELPLKTMADETGIEKEMLLKMLKRLKSKIFYIDGWIYLKNFTKHQSPSEKIIIGIENGKKLVPPHILKKIYDMDKVSIPTQVFESELEPELEFESKLESETTPAQEAKEFFSGKFDPILREFVEKTKVSEEILRQEFSKFILYWTEKNKSGTKQRWEQQATFEVKRRLVTWLGRVKQFSKVEFSKGRGLA